MKRFAAMLLCIFLLLGLCTPVLAQEKQHDYSTTANSGIRHEVCTTLEGTRADTYYTGAYTYEKLSALEGDQLLSSLRTLMTQTHTKKSTYNDCRDKAVKTDCENGDGVTVSLIYSSYSATWDDWCYYRSDGWDREHVWPISLGGFTKNDAPGCDMHHIRPSDRNVNSTRGNRLYGEVDSGQEVYSASYTGSLLGGTYTSTYFEPVDNVKGDVARICLYLYVRYGSEYSACSDITNVFQSVDVLLAWCELDPVDTWEMGRNEVVAAYQGNRNVFIDYPELAWLLFDEQIPADMVTPSGNAAGQQPCTHSSTQIRGKKAATCTESGYTGDTYCADCGEKLSNGTNVAALDHTNANGDNACDRCGAAVECTHGETELWNMHDASCGAEGYTGDTTCRHCGAVLQAGEAIPATGAHSFGAWTVTKDATTEEAGLQERVCTLCGETETQQIPRLDPEPDEPDTTPTEPDPHPSGSDTDPTQTAEPDKDEDGESKDDYRWLVLTVIGVGAVTSVVIVLIQTKQKKS